MKALMRSSLIRRTDSSGTAEGFSKLDFREVVTSAFSIGMIPVESLRGDFQGFLKYSSTEPLTSWSWFKIQRTMNRAIMAVTKSAYATFHEPPPPAAIGFDL